jgi:TorA maturation chaperone TorD
MREGALEPSAAGLDSIDAAVAEAVARVDPIDRLRAQEYALLAALLVRAPSGDLLSRLAGLSGDDSPLGSAHRSLAEAARQADLETLGREFFDLFVGVGRGELLPYASYYLTSLLNERPLAQLREDLDAIGVERADDNPEPEDHIAILCEVMAGLAAGEFAAAAGMQRRFFERHLKPWAERFFADLENARSARFYRAVGAFGRLLIEIEAEAFTME